MINTQITNRQFVTFTLAPKTDQDVVIDVSPAPTYSFETGPSDPAVITPNPDGFGGQLDSGTAPGDSVFLLQFTSGGVPGSAEIMVTVTADGRIGNPVITFGPPQDKPSIPIP